MAKKKPEAKLAEVEDALLRRALGFRQEELYAEDVVDKKSGEVVELIKRRRVEKIVPPDVRALLFYLKNRCPERWKDKVEESDDCLDYEFDETESEL